MHNFGKTRTFSDIVFDLFSSCLSSVVRSSCALLERAVEDPVHPNPLDYSPVEHVERKADYLFAPFSFTSCFAVVFFLFVSLNGVCHCSHHIQLRRNIDLVKYSTRSGHFSVRCFSWMSERLCGFFVVFLHQ